VLCAPEGDDWLALMDKPIPLDLLSSWPVLPGCGATVVFAGTVRDYSEGRPEVSALEYEAYGEGFMGSLRVIAEQLRKRWPSTGRVALVHRVGMLAPTDVSVVVAVSAPHRAEAFEAARFGIEAVKARAPIWKREVWSGGSEWGLDSHPIEEASMIGSREELGNSGWGC
jgi:molybdopterin synthase catalytic subunit